MHGGQAGERVDDALSDAGDHHLVHPRAAETARHKRDALRFLAEHHVPRTLVPEQLACSLAEHGDHGHDLCACGGA